ncbi:MAG: hypothetical protein DRN29_01900 [Thermoplasmata archaeon]|nr:MAG: hypothetical protein DRN29_01900 [Thermoplasmata archaeon]
MRVYIGTFGEGEAEVVAEDLRKAGIRTELKHSLNIEGEGSYSVQGKISELKEKYKEDRIAEEIKKMEEYMKKAREVMEDGMDKKDFEEKFLDLVMPERKEYAELRKTINERIKNADIVESGKIYDEIAKEIGKEKLEKYLNQFFREMEFMAYFHFLLEKNGIRYKDGKMYGEVSEDPFIKIYIHGVSDEEADKLDLRYELKALVDKRVDVYANLIDIVYETGRLEKLIKEKPEYSKLLFMADIVTMTLSKVEGKMDLNEYIDSIKILKQNGNEISLTRPAINEILKTLEKAELIKVKKGKIMPKEKKKR